MHRIEAAEPYPDGYDATVARNAREPDSDARPAMAAPPPSIGKTIFPVTTHAMSGLGTTERDYARSCPGATIGEGLAVRGEEVRDAGPDLESWLRRTGLLRS